MSSNLLIYTVKVLYRNMSFLMSAHRLLSTWDSFGCVLRFYYHVTSIPFPYSFSEVQIQCATFYPSAKPDDSFGKPTSCWVAAATCDSWKHLSLSSRASQGVDEVNLSRFFGWSSQRLAVAWQWEYRILYKSRKPLDLECRTWCTPKTLGSLQGPPGLCPLLWGYILNFQNHCPVKSAHSLCPSAPWTSAKYQEEGCSPIMQSSGGQCSSEYPNSRAWSRVCGVM